MNPLSRWVRRHLQAADPMEPASPPRPNQSAEDFEPYLPPANEAELEHWRQRARELRFETVFMDVPVFDQVNADAMSRDGLAAEVEQWLATQTGSTS